MSLLNDLPRIWMGSDDAANATCLFRRTFDCPEIACSARLTLFAESVFHVWVNGSYRGRGPAFHHPHRRTETLFDLTPHVRPGPNTVAILVHAVGVPLHNHLPAQTPGLVAAIQVETLRQSLLFTTAEPWKACAQSGWDANTPRRSWAIGFVESFDARLAPAGWQDPEFDDRDWPEPPRLPAFRPEAPGIYIDPGLPALRYFFMPAARMLRACSSSGPARPLSRQDKSSELGQSLLNETWSDSHAWRTEGPDIRTGALSLENLRPDENAVLVFDLGAQFTGSAVFEMEAETEGTADIGWAELMADGKPQVMRKGNSYVDRILARRGKTNWMPVGFSSGRYLLLVLRGFKGRVRFSRLGWLASEPDLPWNGLFSCNDPDLTAIWRLSARTQRVGTQEGLMDCPTREQAPYIGDGNPCAEWIYRLTGSSAYWTNLIRETFAVQNEDGLLKSTVFSGIANHLLDYMLLAIIGVRAYVRETGDTATAREVLPGCRKTLDAFLRQCNAEGVYAADWELRDVPWFKRASGEPLQPSSRWIQPPAPAMATLDRPFLNVFIDHPGLGWHNVGEPGIDRRGLNAAMNALLVLAMRAMADLLEITVEPGATELRKRADDLAEKAGRLFWNEAEQAFADGFRKGELLPQISQQTNTWCVAAGFAAGEKANALLRRILKDDDPDMALCGPYFYFYLLPVLADNGLLPEALSVIRKRWTVMLDHDATCLWETFNGDHLDSFCHPWSGAPVDFLPRYAAGIGPVPAGAVHVDIRPAIDALASCDSLVMTAQGPVRVAWSRNDRQVQLSGSLPASLIGRLYLPGGTVTEVRGSWSHEIVL